jgi:hypothetical protein
MPAHEMNGWIAYLNHQQRTQHRNG